MEPALGKVGEAAGSALVASCSKTRTGIATTAPAEGKGWADAETGVPGETLGAEASCPSAKRASGSPSESPPVTTASSLGPPLRREGGGLGEPSAASSTSTFCPQYGHQTPWAPGARWSSNEDAHPGHSNFMALFESVICPHHNPRFNARQRLRNRVVEW
jgi:hypothetical protein